MKVNGRIGAHCFLLMLMTAAAWAQIQTPPAPAELDGQVTAENTPVPGVLVTATDRQGHRFSTSTGIDGRFRLPTPAPGEYRITADFPGFAAATQAAAVHSGTPARISIHLQLESVRAAAPPRSGTGSQRRFSGFQRTRVQFNSVPESGGLGDASSETAGDSQEAASNDSGVTALPGMTTDAPVESMSVAGNLGQNEQQDEERPSFSRRGPGGPGGPGGFGGRGGFGGGPVILRSRGRQRFNPNRLRGSINYSLGDSIFDARPYALSGVPAAKQPYNRQRIGAVIGGPLQIPGLYHSDRTSFFLGFFLNHAANPFDTFSTVPSLAERQGDFSGLTSNSGKPVQIDDPATHQPFSGNVIPQNLLNPAALGLLQYIPLPNQPGATRNFHYSTTDTSDNHTIFLRLSHAFGNSSGRGGPVRRRNNLNFNLNYQGSNAQNVEPFPTVEGTTRQRGMNVQVGYSTTFGRLFNNAHIRLNRSRIATSNLYAFNTNVAGQLGITGVSAAPFDWGVPSLSFTHYTGLNDIAPVLRRDQTAEFSDQMMLRNGRHIWRFGGDFRRIDNSPESDSNARGSFVFSGLYTAQTAHGAAVPGTGYDFADFLLGLASQTSVRYAPGPYYLQGVSWDLFVQQQWQVRSNVTLNLGVRYEYVSPFSEKYGRMVNLDIVNLDAAPGSTAVTPVEPGQRAPSIGIAPPSLVRPDRNNFAPRLGLAWAPNRKTVVRAGYGINYTTGAYGSIASQLTLQPPFSTSLSLIGSAANPLTLENGFPAAAVEPVANTFGIDPNFRLGYVQIWNFNVQRELASNLVLNLDYTGTKGTALEMMRAPNRGPGGLLLKGVAPFLWESSEADSIAHAGSLRLRKRMASGFSIGGTYTWAKSIDNASSIGGGATVVAQNDLNLAAERGLSSFDVRQRLGFDSTWQLPFGQDKPWLNRGGLAASLFGDWQLNEAIHWNTGTPFTAQVLGTYNEIASGVNGTLRADATGQPVTLANSSTAAFFNTSAFVLPPAGQFGTAGRNTIPGPGLFNLDLSLNKVVHFGDTRSLEVRAQANNLLNSAEYSSIGTIVNAPTFGQVLSVRSMRQIQLVTRFRF